ncbi:protein-L-isoaspartate O-methyltransferase [Sulfurimonas sp. ST-27]|uniref:protein-L-isoaspartate O-methyltransferase n=1 Tax=Sulfurimonas sp. ST-27 TaxID=3400152 RepID=UPI003AB6F802
MSTNRELIQSMQNSGVLKTPQIIEAFEKIDRKYFVPEGFEEAIYRDAPLPIGEGQTISQPSTVAFMLELLQPRQGDSVLDIGSGSAWTTSLLCAIVGESGHVTGMERVERLVSIGQKNLSQFGFGQCHIEKAGKELGKPGEQFDKILVSASAPEIPFSLFEQLKPNGVLVIPVGNSIFKFKKLQDGRIQQEEYAGFVFVPLIYQEKQFH